MADKQATDNKNANQNVNVESNPLTEKDKELLRYFNENIGDASTQVVDHTDKKEDFLKEVSAVVREVQEKARLQKRKKVTEMIINASDNEKPATDSQKKKEQTTNVESNEQNKQMERKEIASEKKVEENQTNSTSSDSKENDVVYDKVYTEYRVANDDPTPTTEPMQEQLEVEEKKEENEQEKTQQKKESFFAFLKPKPKKNSEQKSSASKKSSDKSYKPPFYQTFKFWAIIVACVCILTLIGFVIYSSIKNAPPKLPTGIIFEANQGLEGFVEQTDTLVLSPNSGTDSLQVRVKFKNNFSGTIKLSLSIRIATLDKDVVSNGDIVVIKALHSEQGNVNSELIGGKTQLKAEYKTVHAELEILIDKQMTDLNLSSSYTNDDANALTNKIGQVEFDNKMNNNLFYVDRTVCLTAEPRYGFITIGRPNGDDYNREIIWESDNTDIATVDSNGLVTSYKSGTVTFTARAKAFYLDQFYTMAREITLNFEDVPVYSLKIKNDMDNITLWLSDTAKEIDVRDYVEIIPNNSNVPNNFTADYLYNNAELLCLENDSVSKSLVINGVKNKLGCFTLYNNTTEAETRIGVSPINLTVRFGTATSLWLDNYGTSKIAVTIKRNKNLMLTLPENANNNVQIQNIAFYNGVNKEPVQSYSRVDLQRLFNLIVIDSEQTNNSGADAKGNNFDTSRDIVYAKYDKDDDRYEIEYDETTNRYYFVPNKDVLTAAMEYSQGFRIYAYLKDINSKNADLITENGGYAEIDGTSTESSRTTLFVNVVAPTNVTLDARTPTIRVSKKEQTKDIFRDIYENFNSLRVAIQSNSATTFVNVTKENLLNATSEDNTSTPYKVYIELERQDSSIYINNKTIVGINDNATINSIHTVTVKFMYVYNVTPPSTSTNPNSNIVELATLDINIEIVA